MNMDATTAVVAVGSLVVSYLALGATRSSADVAGYLWCFEQLRQTFQTRQALAAAGPCHQAWPEELKTKAHHMMTALEEIATCCAYGAVTKTTIVETGAWTILDAWILTHAYLKELREVRGQPRQIAVIPRIGRRRIPFVRTNGAHARRQFELLARACATYMKQHHRSAYETLLESRGTLGFDVSEL